MFGSSSRNLMLFFHFRLSKSRKLRLAKYFQEIIAKLSTREMKYEHGTVIFKMLSACEDKLFQTISTQSPIFLFGAVISLVILFAIIYFSLASWNRQSRNGRRLSRRRRIPIVRVRRQGRRTSVDKRPNPPSRQREPLLARMVTELYRNLRAKSVEGKGVFAMSRPKWRQFNVVMTSSETLVGR